MQKNTTDKTREQSYNDGNDGNDGWDDMPLSTSNEPVFAYFTRV